MRNLIFFAFSCCASSTWAACGLTLSASNITINWDLNFSTMAVQIIVNKSGAAACDFGIGFSKGGASSYLTRRGADGSKSLRYQLYKDNALNKVLKDVPDITTSDDVLTGGFPAGTNLNQTILYYLEIPYSMATTPVLAAAGSYTDNFTINLYEGSNPLAFATPEDSASIALSVNVDKLIAVSLVDSGGAFQTSSTSRSIDFGSLSDGESSSFDMRVRTNAGFSVTFSSANNGRLKHINPAKNSFVSYKLYVNSVLLNMSSSSGSPVTGLGGGGSTAMDGLAYPIKIVIGNVGGMSSVSGRHEDQITMTATTTE